MNALDQRRILCTLAALCAALPCLGSLHAQMLPANPPTALSVANSLPAPISASSSGPASVRAKRAQIAFQDGLLNVRADNSSLNGILRDIAKATGMTITGGVAEQRVFGNYGPALPSTVLATLLDGTGSNMLLRETSAATPAELVLTPRTGGVTPPNPSAHGFDEDDPSEPEERVPQQRENVPPPPMAFRGSSAGPKQPFGAVNEQQQGQQNNSTSGPQSIAQPLNNVLGSPNTVSPSASTLPVANSVPTDALPTPSTNPGVSGIVDTPNFTPSTNLAAPGTMSGDTTSSGTTTGSTLPQAATPAPGTPAANGTSAAGAAKTPEQIYQQLQQLMNAQKKQ